MFAVLYITALNTQKLPYGSGSTVIIYQHSGWCGQANANSNKVVNTPAGFRVDVTCSLSNPQGSQ